jgi:YHS domain-containing protein
MLLDPSKAVQLEHPGRRYTFCSPACAALFQAAPERYLRAADASEDGASGAAGT